ncbi:hypothetical protein CC86DRAFT_412549 [Ophiobolus disseminans]|uniref:Uncharacterized protein n=1 Tax=Ophiobolus disseminans TaxID=1469910 RepID=A0A6A6ZH78_9PLEO|nr:hypothetical protein CC86DRAFT_412549 [Ophiobolus disseminans]
MEVITGKISDKLRRLEDQLERFGYCTRIRNDERTSDYSESLLRDYRGLLLLNNVVEDLHDDQTKGNKILWMAQCDEELQWLTRVFEKEQKLVWDYEESNGSTLPSSTGMKALQKQRKAAIQSFRDILLTAHRIISTEEIYHKLQDISIKQNRLLQHVDKTEMQLTGISEAVNDLASMVSSRQSSSRSVIASGPESTTVHRTTIPSADTYPAFLWIGDRAEDPPELSLNIKVNVTATVEPSLRGCLINQEVARGSGLLINLNVAEDKTAWRNVRGETYYPTKCVKITWNVPEYMKQRREDVFYIVPDLPYDILVPSIRSNDRDRVLLDATRPEQDEIEPQPLEAFPTLGRRRSKREKKEDSDAHWVELRRQAEEYEQSLSQEVSPAPSSAPAAQNNASTPVPTPIAASSSDPNLVSATASSSEIALQNATMVPGSFTTLKIPTRSSPPNLVSSTSAAPTSPSSSATSSAPTTPMPQIIASASTTAAPVVSPAPPASAPTTPTPSISTTPAPSTSTPALSTNTTPATPSSSITNGSAKPSSRSRLKIPSFFSRSKSK